MEQTAAQRILMAKPEEMADISIGQLHAALMQHFEDDVNTFEEFRKLLKSIDEKLSPISDTYATASRMGKWGMASLVGLSMLIGIVYTAIQILMAYKQH